MTTLPKLAALVALIAAAPLAAQTGPKPRNDPGTWIVADDYPPAALRTRAEGTLAFKLDVDADGHPVKCEIVSSSDVPELDEAACAKVLERARFTPAQDDAGRAVAGTYRTTVRFQMPDDRTPLPDGGDAIFTFEVEKDGSVSGCSVRGSNSLVSEDMCANPPSFEIPRNEAGEPVRQRVVVRTKIEISELPD